MIKCVLYSTIGGQEQTKSSYFDESDRADPFSLDLVPQADYYESAQWNKQLESTAHDALVAQRKQWKAQ